MEIFGLLIGGIVEALQPANLSLADRPVRGRNAGARLSQWGCDPLAIHLRDSRMDRIDYRTDDLPRRDLLWRDVWRGDLFDNAGNTGSLDGGRNHI